MKKVISKQQGLLYKLNLTNTKLSDSMNWRVAILNGLFILSGCNFSGSNCDEINYSPLLNGGKVVLVSKYKTSFTEELFRKHPFNNHIPYCLSSDGSSVYLNYISKDGVLIQANLLDSTKIFKTPVKFIASTLVDMSLKADSICLLDQENKKFYILTRQDTKGYSSSVDIDLSPGFINTSNFIKFSLEVSQFQYEKPLLYFNIGDTKGRNYLNEKSLMVYNIETGSFKLICPYPRCFSEHDIYDEHTQFSPVSKDKILISYNFLDVIRCYDSSDRVRFEVLPNHPEPMKEFDKKKELNAAYVRKHMVTSDMNLGIMALDSLRFIVFRKTSKKNVTDTANYYCNYFKDNGNYRAEIKIKPVVMRNIVKFRQGFFALSIDMKSGELYECQ